MTEDGAKGLDGLFVRTKSGAEATAVQTLGETVRQVAGNCVDIQNGCVMVAA
jgi:hypothetical protein